MKPSTNLLRSHRPSPIAWALALVLLPVCALAADAPPDAGSAPKLNLLLALIPVIVPVALAILKFFAPKLPTAALPVLAPLLGAAADWLGTGQFGAGTVLGAIAGSAGVGLREIVDQLKQVNRHGVTTVGDNQRP